MANLTLIGSGALSSAESIASLRQNSAEAGRDIQRLSSGERITRAADDIASFSIATKMELRLTSLRSAQLNLQQAGSLIEVMNGGLQQIDSILQRMNALAVQATGGGLTAADRGFLDQEFQQLSAEIDRISSQTEFNGIQAISRDSTEKVFTDALRLDDELGDEYAARLIFSTNWTGNNRFIRLGSSDNAPDNELIVWRDDTSIGNPAFNVQNVDSLEGKLQGLVNLLNDPDGPISQNPIYGDVKFELENANTIKVTGRSRGELSSLFFVSDRTAQTDVRSSLSVIGEGWRGSGTNYDYILTAQNTGSDTGLIMGSTSVTGSSGNNLIAAQQQNQGEIRLSIDNLTSGITDGQRINIDSGFDTSTLSYRFRDAPTDPTREIQIGADNIETLKNTVTFFNELRENNKTRFDAGLSVAELYMIEHFEFERDGLDLVIRSTLPGNPTDLFGNNAEFDENITAGTLSATFMENGLDQGVNSDGVVNKDFVGTLQGFNAEYISDNNISLSIEVGEATYTASITNTLPTENTRIRFFSDTHGYFDVDLALNSERNITSQADADIYAGEFDIAFSGLNFYQERVITNFRPFGRLNDMQLSIKREDFSEAMIIEAFNVISADSNNGSAELTMVVNGETFTSTQTLDRSIDPYANIRMISTEDSNRVITLTNNTQNFAVESDDDASRFETLMRDALPFGSVTTAAQALVFQAGQDADNTVIVNTVDASTTNIFSNQSINIMTPEQAASAVTIVSAAIDIITSQRAEIGAAQQRTDFASNVITTAIVNQDSARSTLVDTDIATTSTDFALRQVKMNAAIAVIAQTNQLQRALIEDVYSSLAQL